MDSITVVGLLGALAPALVAGWLWAKGRKRPTPKATAETNAEHPYATPADQFMVWPADPKVRAAPKERALMQALDHTPTNLQSEKGHV